MLDNKADKNQENLRSRLDNLRQAVNGESVLGRYAAAEVEERRMQAEPVLPASRDAVPEDVLGERDVAGRFGQEEVRRRLAEGRPAAEEEARS